MYRNPANPANGPAIAPMKVPISDRVQQCNNPTIQIITMEIGTVHAQMDAQNLGSLKSLKNSFILKI